ncbi:hypothetical protein H4R19_000495 [Coemansia spiralis]|nr:hypothetical protein H4R19_000495 [Coemansia spiralis]
MGNFGSRLRRDSPGEDSADKAKRPRVWRIKSKTKGSTHAASDTPKTSDTPPVLAAVDVADSVLAFDTLGAAGADSDSTHRAPGIITHQSSGQAGDNVGGFHVPGAAPLSGSEIGTVGGFNTGPHDAH